MIFSAEPDRSGSAAEVFLEDGALDYWASKRELFIPDEDLVAHYTGVDDRLSLRIKSDDSWDAATIELVRFDGELSRE